MDQLYRLRHRRTAVRLGLAAVAIAACALTLAVGPAGAASHARAAKSTAPTCGGEHLATSRNANWVCTFDDEFNGHRLNRRAWSPLPTALHGFHLGDECMINSRKNIAVSHGTLKLTVRKTPDPFTCPGGTAKSYRTHYTGATVYTTKFSQLYGRFEIRAKFAAGHGQPGLQGSLWMYPTALTASSLLAPNEIDIAEAYSKYPKLVIPAVHSTSLLSSGQHNCKVSGASGRYHTYAVEWDRMNIVFYIDGTKCYQQSNVLGGSSKSNGFFIVLSQGLGSGRNAQTAKTALPGTLKIDYVRAWK